VTLIAFDLPELDGRNLRGEPMVGKSELAGGSTAASWVSYSMRYSMIRAIVFERPYVLGSKGSSRSGAGRGIRRWPNRALAQGEEPGRAGARHSPYLYSVAVSTLNRGGGLGARVRHAGFQI
jgi:hypothetical protein